MQSFSTPNFHEQAKLLYELWQENPTAEAHWCKQEGKMPVCDTDFDNYGLEDKILLTDFDGFIYLVTQTQIKFCQDCAQKVSQRLWTNRLEQVVKGTLNPGLPFSKN